MTGQEALDAMTGQEALDAILASPDMPDAPEGEGADATEVNSAADLVGEDGAEEDDSPVITNLLITNGHTPAAGEKSGYTHTDIRANIVGKNGHEAKRIVIPGGVTAKKLCELLADVGKW